MIKKLLTNRNLDKNLLWKFVEFKEGNQVLELKAEMAINLLVNGLEFDELLDKLISNFASTPTNDNLNHARIYIVKSSGLLSIHQRLILFAELCRRDKLPLKDVAIAISAISPEDWMLLSEIEESIVLTAKMVVEDFQEGFLEIDEDDIFKNKLLRVLTK